MSDNLAYNSKAKHNYESQFNSKIYKPVEQKIDDMCPICLIELDDKSNKNELYYCKFSCGKSVHKECFDMWVNSGERNNKCMFCRAPWDIQLNENDTDIDNYSDLKLKELQELCIKYNLSKYGTKDKLINRLRNRN